MIGTGSSWTTLVWEFLELDDGRCVLSATDPIGGAAHAMDDEGDYFIRNQRDDAAGWQAFRGGYGSPITVPTCLGNAMAACEANVICRVERFLSEAKKRPAARRRRQ